MGPQGGDRLCFKEGTSVGKDAFGAKVLAGEMDSCTVVASAREARKFSMMASSSSAAPEYSSSDGAANDSALLACPLLGALRKVVIL